MPTVLTPSHQLLLSEVSLLAAANSLSVYLVGGTIRDLLFELPTKDIDFAVQGHALRFASEFQSRYGGEVRTFERFGTAKVVGAPAFPDIEDIDFASTRSEVYEHPGGLPRIAAAQLGPDLARRDFTINAMAIEPSKLLDCWLAKGDRRQLLLAALIDPLGGRADLAARCVRSLHARSFMDDPTRVFRAFRYAIRIAGEVEAITLEQVRQAIEQGALGLISIQRVMNEWRRVLNEPQAGVVVQRLVNECVLLGCGMVALQWQDQFVALTQSLLESAGKSAALSGDIKKLEALMLRALLYFRSHDERTAFSDRLQLGRKALQRIENEFDTAGQESAEPDLAQLFQRGRGAVGC